MSSNNKEVNECWEDFRNSGMLWFVNRIIHVFGWAIVFVIEENTNADSVLSVYPARTKYRGFDNDVEDKGFKDISDYMVKNAAQLQREVNE